jgi:hypothetical protein
MRINFFEEYPTDENLKKAELIDFNSTIFLAAHSLEEFYKYKEKLLTINKNLDVAYWPILPRTYWISPFSYTSDLEKLFKELKQTKEKITVLIDLELPVMNNKLLLVRNLFGFLKNKKILKKFIKKAPLYNINIITAEYPPVNLFFLWLYRIFGISYNPEIYGNTSCIIYYTSMFSNKYILQKITKTIIDIVTKQNPKLELGLGTIATGVMGNEPILSPKNLTRDLSFMKKNNFETATIFRLGGFDMEYYKIIKLYI